MKALPLTVLLSGAMMAASAHASDAILKCRALADGPARLACYDAIDVKAQPAPAARSKEEGFGLGPAVTAPAIRKDEAKSVTSTIEGRFDGWGPGAQITLANGQVWRVVDGSEVALPAARNPKVSIERGMLGAFYLQVEGSNNTARVSRVK
ncbi:MAG: hypothetical protein AB1437_18185 [Pseudomonadota bacterium]